MVTIFDNIIAFSFVDGVCVFIAVCAHLDG